MNKNNEKPLIGNWSSDSYDYMHHLRVSQWLRLHHLWPVESRPGPWRLYDTAWTWQRWTTTLQPQGRLGSGGRLSSDSWNNKTCIIQIRILIQWTTWLSTLPLLDWKFCFLALVPPPLPLFGQNVPLFDKKKFTVKLINSLHTSHKSFLWSELISHFLAIVFTSKWRSVKTTR